MNLVVVDNRNLVQKFLKLWRKNFETVGKRKKPCHHDTHNQHEQSRNLHLMPEHEFKQQMEDISRSYACDEK